ncbi:condensation domain-containing protein [Oerskovia paurometabola]|uniref:condensation domain-containing protein n=1 Tax=Oerskovia paurometabola TaxID=162170 RepID=UPI00344969AC
MDLSTRSIEFDQLVGRSGPMMWGQKAIYKSIRWLAEDAHYFNLFRVIDVPDGMAVGDLGGALGSLIARHEVLRTLFHDSAAGWTQDVRPAGRLVADLVPARENASAEVAGGVVKDLMGRSFRHSEELPVRFSIVLEDSRPRKVVMVVSHLAVDGWSADLLKQDLIGLLRGDAGPAPHWQPVDQAAAEADGAGAARGVAAVDYWSKTLSSNPPSPVRPVVDTGRPGRSVRLGMSSTALAVAASAVATRCGVSTGTVLLAATAVVVGRHTGRKEVALQLIAANRLDARSRGLVGALAENALFVIDTSPAAVDGDFQTVAKRAFGAGLNAYRHAQYDPLVLDDVLERIRTQNGGALDLGYFFNDMRIGRDWSDIPEWDSEPDRLRELAQETEISLVGSWERQDATFFVHTEDATNTCRLFLMADTELIPAQEIEKLLLSMESVVVEAAIAG